MSAFNSSFFFDVQYLLSLFQASVNSFLMSSLSL